MPWSRREFLSSTGALAVNAALGGHLLGCRPGPDFDLCIVGSGFAGTFLGLEAARAGIKTVIIEAGADPSSPASGEGLAANFRFLNSGAIRYPVAAARAIGVGGTSNRWAGVLSRLWPDDLKMHSLYGLAADWPIDYDELEPFYCRAETALSAEGYPPQSGEPARQCPYPKTVSDPYRGPAKLLAVDELQFYPVAGSRRDGQPVRLVQKEIPALVRERSATLLTDRQVTRLVTLDGQRLHHLETQGPDGRREVVRARAFVLAAGAIECPRLLLLSTSDWFPTGLGNQSDLVGRYFHVHPLVVLKFQSRSPLSISDCGHRSYALSASYRQRGLTGCSLQFHQLQGNRILWKIQPETEPRWANRIRLSPTEHDHFGDPIPVVELGYSERDRKTMSEGEAIAQAQVERLKKAGTQVKRARRWRMHPAGTCRMGRDETSGVTDRNGKVYGVGNLFVSGACVFPTSGTSNPTLTVVALTQRLADHLKRLLL